MSRLPLTGRAVELTAIDDALAAGSALLLCGAAGAGKTRLAEEARERAEARQMAVGWGAAWDPSGPAFWPLVEAARDLADVEPLHRLARAGGDPADRNAEVVDTLAAVLRRAGPALIVIDDVHCADHATLRALGLLLRARRLAVTWVLTARRPEVDAVPAVAALGAQTIDLEPLGDDAVGALVRARYGGADAAWVDDLCRLTRGNPLYVAQVLATTRPGDAIAIPDGLRGAIRGRLARLDAGARVTLEAAAAIGADVPLPLLAALLDIPVDATLRAIEPAVRAGFLVDPGGARVRFAHPLYREVLEGDIEPSRRRRLHATAFAALGSAGAPSERARHAVAAVPLVSAGEASAALGRAAERAMTLAAHEDAADLWRRAGELADTPTSRAEAAIGHAIALHRSGARNESRAAAAEAVELARAIGDPVRVAHAALAAGAGLVLAMVDGALVQLLEDALANLPADASRLRAQLSARLAAARTPAPDMEPVVALARQAVELARAAGDDATLLPTLFWSGAALATAVPARERIDDDRTLVAVASRVGDLVAAQRGWARLVIDHLELGEPGEADVALTAHGAIAARLRPAAYRWSHPMLAVIRAQMEGRAADALALSAQGRALAEEASDRAGMRSWTLQQVVLLRDFGDPAALVAHGARVEELLRGTSQLSVTDRLFEAAIRSWAGDHDATAAALRAAPVDLPRGLPLPALAMATDAIFFLGDAARAAALLPRVRALAPHQITWSLLGMGWEGPTERLVGLLLATIGDLDGARAALDLAHAESVRVGARTSAARLACDRGELALRAGDTGAHKLVEDARVDATAIGMPVLLARLARLRREAPRAQPAPIPSPRAAPLVIRRDGDGWAIEAGGEPLRLRDSRGLRLLARLAETPGREVHVLELEGAAGADAGDAGELLDPAAIAMYRARLVELRADLERAEDDADLARAERLRVEADALGDELVRALGLGGRARRAGSAVERARVNVQRRLRDAVRKIASLDPELGRRVERALRTGTFCAFDP